MLSRNSIPLSLSLSHGGERGPSSKAKKAPGSATVRGSSRPKVRSHKPFGDTLARGEACSCKYRNNQQGFCATLYCPEVPFRTATVA